MSVHGIAESRTQFATEQQHRIYTKSETFCKLYTRGDNDASMLRFINFTKGATQVYKDKGYVGILCALC